MQPQMPSVQKIKFSFCHSVFSAIDLSELSESGSTIESVKKIHESKLKGVTKSEAANGESGDYRVVD